MQNASASFLIASFFSFLTSLSASFSGAKSSSLITTALLNALSSVAPLKALFNSSWLLNFLVLTYCECSTFSSNAFSADLLFIPCFLLLILSLSFDSNLKPDNKLFFLTGLFFASSSS